MSKKNKLKTRQNARAFDIQSVLNLLVLAACFRCHTIRMAAIQKCHWRHWIG